MKPTTPVLHIYAGTAVTTGEMSDSVDASRPPPNRRRYLGARSLPGGEIDPAPADILLIEAWPHCRMKYNIAARHLWAKVGAFIGLRLKEPGERW